MVKENRCYTNSYHSADGSDKLTGTHTGENLKLMDVGWGADNLRLKDEEQWPRRGGNVWSRQTEKSSEWEKSVPWLDRDKAGAAGTGFGNYPKRKQRVSDLPMVTQPGSEAEIHIQVL